MELPLVLGLAMVPGSSPMPLHQRLGQLAMINNWWMWGRDPVRDSTDSSKAHLPTLVRERHLHPSITILGATKTLIHFRGLEISKRPIGNGRWWQCSKTLFPPAVQRVTSWAASDLGERLVAISTYPAPTELPSRDSTCSICTGSFVLSCYVWETGLKLHM